MYRKASRRLTKSRRCITVNIRQISERNQYEKKSVFIFNNSNSINNSDITVLLHSRQSKFRRLFAKQLSVIIRRQLEQFPAHRDLCAVRRDIG